MQIFVSVIDDGSQKSHLKLDKCTVRGYFPIKVEAKLSKSESLLTLEVILTVVYC